MLDDGLEDRGFVAHLMRRGARDDDRLGVDHFPHHAPARIGRGHQDRADAEPLGGHLLKVAEKRIRAGVGPRQGHSQPAEKRAEEGKQRAGLRQAQPEDRVHSRVPRDVRQANHEADRQQRRSTAGRTVRTKLRPIRAGLIPSRARPAPPARTRRCREPPGHSSRQSRPRVPASARPAAFAAPPDGGRAPAASRCQRSAGELISGLAHRKMNKETSRKGDQPLSTAAKECRRCDAGSRSVRRRARIPWRRSAIPGCSSAARSSEKRPWPRSDTSAAMMSTSPDSW